MQIHNTLNAGWRKRSVDALDAVIINLSKCRRSVGQVADEHLYELERDGIDGTDVETLRLRLRRHELRVFIAIARGRKVHRTSFVEPLQDVPSIGATTFVQAAGRLSEWRRLLVHEPSESALHTVQVETSRIVSAAVGAATRLDDRWKTLGIYPAFGSKPPLLLLGCPPGKTSVFGASGELTGSSGTMSDALVRELSALSDRLFVTTSKTSSNPGIQVDFGPLPSIHVVNDLSPMDLLHAMRHAEAGDLSLNP